MDKWYYVEGGQQNGPISREELVNLLKVGRLDAGTTQVWKEGMANWARAIELPELMANVSASGGVPGDMLGQDIYAPPEANPVQVGAGGSGAVLELPSQPFPLDISLVISRGVALLHSRFGVALGGVIVYLALYFGSSFGLEIIALPFAERAPSQYLLIKLVSFVIGSAISAFLTLGLVRLFINLVRGDDTSVGDLFVEGGKLVRGFFASLLFGIAVGFGFLLLIVPGIYLFARFGFFYYAIVDKDLGIGASYSYSSELTRGNLLMLAVLGFILFVINGLGFVTCIGWLWTIPATAAVWTAAYFYLHGGEGALRVP